MSLVINTWDDCCRLLYETQDLVKELSITENKTCQDEYIVKIKNIVCELEKYDKERFAKRIYDRWDISQKIINYYNTDYMRDVIEPLIGYYPYQYRGKNFQKMINILTWIYRLGLFDFTNDERNKCVFTMAVEVGSMKLINLLISFGININICAPKEFYCQLHKRSIIGKFLINNGNYDISSGLLNDYILNNYDTDEDVCNEIINDGTMLKKFINRPFIENETIGEKMHYLIELGFDPKKCHISKFNKYLSYHLDRYYDILEIVLYSGYCPFNYRENITIIGDKITLLNYYKMKWIEKHYIGPMVILIRKKIITRTVITIILSLLHIDIGKSIDFIDSKLFPYDLKF